MQPNPNHPAPNSSTEPIVSKPPAFPKASRTNQIHIHRQRQLKDRLKLKWGNSKPNPVSAVNDIGEDQRQYYSPSDGVIIKGYGENQFNDSVLDNIPPNSMSLFNQPSTLIETEESKFFANNKSELKISQVNKTYITALPSHYESATATVFDPSPSIITGREDGNNEFSKYQSHLGMSRSLAEGGYSEVAEHLVDGRTDFCYLQPDKDNFYKFGIKAQYPSQNSKGDAEFTTISARGMLRFTAEGSELISFETMLKEKLVYDSLLKLRIFKNFWVWKTFYGWRRYIVTRRMERLSNSVRKSLILLDPLCRDLILSARTVLDQMTKEKMFVIDESTTIPFQAFIDTQKNKNLYWKNRIQKSIHDIVALLCDRCEDYVFEAATVAPPSMAAKQFDQLKVGRTMQHSQLVEIIKPDKSVTYQLLSAVEEMKNKDPVQLEGGSLTLPLGEKDSTATTTVKKRSPVAKQEKQQNKRKSKKTVHQRDLNYSSDEYDYTEDFPEEREDSISPRDILADLSFHSAMNVPYSVRAAIRLRCRKLVSLFRLIDYMVRDKLYDFLLNSLYQVENVLREFGNIPYDLKNQESLLLESKTELEIDPIDISQTKEGLLQIAVVFVPDYEREEEPADSIVPIKTTDTSPKMEDKRSNSVSSASPHTHHHSLFKSMIKEINFSPNKFQCLEDLRGILSEIGTYCSYTEGLLTHERCLKIFTPIHSEITRQPLDDRIFLDNEQNRIQSVVKGILHYTAVQCDMVYHDIQSLELFQQRYNENHSLYHKALRNKLLDQSPDIILQHLTKWDDEITQSSSIRFTQRIGIFQCELKSIKFDFQSLIHLTQELYYRLIPDLYVTHGDEFYRDISNHIDKMNAKYHTLDDFIKIIESYQNCFTLLKQVNNKYKYIMNIREIVESRNEIRISEAILRQNLTLTNTFHKFNTLLQGYDELLEEQVKVYRSEMNTRYKRIIVPIQDFKTYIDSINSFMIKDDYQPNAEEILNELQYYKREMEKISKQLLQLDYYQRMLNIVIFEKGIELEVNEELKSNIFLWQSWKTLAELTNSFLSISYLDANCDQIHKEVLIVKSELSANTYFSSINDAINAAMNTTGEEGQANLTLDNEIPSAQRGIYKCFHKILAMASSLLEIIPIIKKLQSNTFKAEHIEAIHSLLHHNIYDDVDIPVQDLIDRIRIQDYSETIGDIYNQSKIQYHLELKVNYYHKYLQNIEFTFSNDIDNKALIYINNFPDIQDKLHDSLLTLQSIASSQSIHAVYKVVMDLIQEVSQWVDAITQFQIFQQKYLQYRTLFTSAKTARQLSPYMKYFKLLDENWRTLIRLSKLSIYIYKFFEEKQVYIILQTIMQSIIGNIEKGIMEIIDDQCEKYYKFYFIDRQTMIELLTNNQLLEILQTLSSFCFPYNITMIETEPHELYNVIGIYCQEEKIIFHKFVSGRSNLADFCKAVEAMIHDRLERDIKELIIDDYNNSNNTNNNNSNLLNAMSMLGGNNNSSSNRQLLDDLRTGKYCEQSQILMFQIKFWSSLDKIFSASSYGKLSINRISIHSPNDFADAGGVLNDEDDEQGEETKRNLHFGLRSLLLELSDQIAMISSILTDMNNSLVTKKVSNVLTAIIYHRDLVRSMIEDESGTLPEKLAGGNDFKNSDQQFFVRSDKIFYSVQKKVLFNQGVQYSTYQYYASNQLAPVTIAEAAAAVSPTVSSPPVHGASIASVMSSQNAASTVHNTGPIITVEQGGFLERYGMKYQGFGARMVLMPVVDKCFFALNQTFRFKHPEFFTTTSANFHVPIVYAQYPKALILGLSHEYGADGYFMNVAQASFLRFANPIEYVTKSIIVAFRLNLLFAIGHVELWTTEMMSYYGNLISTIYQSLFEKKQEVKLPFEANVSSMSVGGISFHSVNPSNNNNNNNNTNKLSSGSIILKKSLTLTPSTIQILPKICLLHSLKIPNRFAEIFQTNKMFLPIQVPPLSMKILLRTILSSFNFVFVNKITVRLEAMIEYLCSSHTADRSFLVKLLVQAIRFVGIENEHTRINVAMQLNLIVKRFFQLLPISIQCRISENEIRLICNLFLEVIYHPDNDRKDFYSFIRPIEYSLNLKRMLIPGLYYGNALHLNEDVSVSSSTVAGEDKEFLLSRYHERNLVLVVGGSNIGKTSLIKSTFDSLQQDLISHNNEMLHAHRNSTNHGNSVDDINNSLPSISFYSTPFNPIVLLGDCNQQVIENDEGLDGATISSQFNRAFQQVLERHLCSIYQSNHIHFIFHLDISSSYHLTFLIEKTHTYLRKFYRNKQIKLVFEMTELVDICPSSLTRVNLLAIHDPIYTLEDIFVKYYKQQTESTSHYYQKALAEIRDLIIRPCVLNYPNDSFVSQFILVKQIFELISDLFHLLIFPINQGSVSAFNYDGISSSAVASTGNAPKSRDAKKAYANYNDFDEDTLRRIGVFACIWTVGVCSQSSRVNFERWFREFFNDEVIKTRTRKIYPILESTISIFKYNLHRIEGTIPSLEWVQYESKVISSFQSTSLKHSPLHGNFHSPSTSSEHDLLISSGLYSLNQHEILVVNSEMKALAHVQAALSHTVYHALNNKNPKLTSKQRAVNGIHLFGECNTGKKSILHYLLQQMAYFSQSSTPNVHRGRSNQHSASSIECCRRWVLHANSSGHSYHTATLQAEILQSKRKLSTYLHEHNLPDYGALFIEDVCLDHPGNLNWKSYAQTPDQVHSHVSEVIRQTVEYQSVFDQVYQQFVSIPMFYAVMNSQSDRNPLHQHQKSYFDQIVGSSKGKLEKSGSTMGAPLGFSANFGMSAISNKESLRIETQEMPTDKYIQFHENSRNERILKHFISFNCNQEIIKDIFAIILSKNYLNASVTLELAKDIIALTHSYYQNLQKVIFELQQISPTSGSSNQNSDISPLSSRAPYYSFRENEKLLLQSLTCQPSLLWTQGTLYKLSAALSYLQFHSVGVTANDILRIWDRLINDINYRFPLVERMSDIFNYAFDDAVNSDSDPTQNYTYSFPSFVSILERERSIRLSNLENALTSYSSPQIDEAISYSRNCLGFFKTVSNSNETPTLANSSTSMLVGRKSITASTIMNAIGPYRGFPSLVSPIISTAEFLREVIFKQIMEKNLALRSISMDEAESNAPELQRLVEIEESYRKNKNNLSFWMDIFRFLNLLDVKPSQPAPLAEFPSNKTIIIMVSPSNVLHNGKLDRLKLASFHLQNSNLREIIIDQEIVEDYLFVSSSSSKRFHQNLYLATLENFFHDPYVIRSLQLFVRRMAKKKLSSPSVAGSRKGSAGSVVSPTQIHQLLEKARAAGNSILGIASSNNSSRRQSRVHPTSENLPFSISALMSSLQLEPNSKYQKRFEKLLNFIHAKLFSSNNSGNFTHNGEGSMDDCLTTIWWLKIDSHLSYELNQEINYNPLKNPSLLISMIKDLGIFESPLIEKFFIQLIHEDFELYLHEELRRLISKYSSHQKFVISIHDGTITPLGNLQEKRAVPAELFTPLFTSYSGSVQVLDLFPEKPPKIEQQDKLLRTASKIPSNEELKRFDAETPNSSRMSEGKGNEDWLNRLGVMQDYVRSLNQFIEKNKLIEKKFALSTANLYQYSRHLHKFLFEHLPDNISKDSVNKNENKGTKRLSINNMKERMNEMFSKLSLSHFNQDMIYNHHNNSTALTHLDQYHILTIVLLSIYSKSVLIKVNLVNDDPYAFSTTIPSLVEYLMKKDIFSLSAPEDTSSNMASSTNEVSRSSIAAPHLFIPYFQLFLSNLQIAFIGYLLNQFLLNPSLSFLDQTLLSTCLKQPPKRGRDIVKFYKKFWIFYQLSPKNTTLKHYLPNLLCSYYLYGKIVFKDSLIFASCSIISLLQLHTSLSNGLPFSLFHIENGKLLTELDSSVCMCHLYEFETAPIFEISKIDIPFFAEILVLSILSKGLLKSLAPELSSLFENLKTVIDNNWRSLESLIVPPSHQQRNSSEEDDDEDELADNEKPYYPSSSAHATFDEMVRYEELFHEATNSITQSLENLMILLSNLLLSVSSTITEEKLYVLFTEFWHIIEEQLEFSEQYLEVMEKRKKSNQKKKSLNQSNQHPIYSSLASIISFSILKFTIDVIPRYLSSETEFYHLLFSVVLDYFFGSYSNHTYENMAHFYRQKFLTQFHQLANFSSPIANPVNASTIPTSTSKVPITPSAASPAHAATNLADGASHLKLKENNPLLHTILFNHARLDWKYGIIRKEQLNLPKLMKVTTEENAITPKSSEKKKNLKTITEDDISDLGSDSEEGNDNEENNNASDDHYILEDSYLSEFSKYLLKQSFTIISQFLNTGILGTFYSRYHSSSSSSSVKNRSSNNYYIINNLQKYSPLHNNAIHSYHTSISIINTIEKNIDEFMDWISNISLSVEALYENYHIFFSPLEELIFIAIMKPILFPQILLHHYYLFGLNLNFQRFSDIQSILLQQKIIRQNLNLLLPSKENSTVQIKYGNYDDYNQIFTNPYMMSGNMSSLLDYTHHRILYKLQHKLSRLEISNSAIKINADQKSLNGIDDASIGSGESNNEKSTVTISSTGLNSIQPLRKRKQSLTDSKRSLSSGEFSNRGNVISLSFPRQYFPHQLILFLQHQFHHLDRDWIRSLSSNKESSQRERLFNLMLLGNSFSTNSTVMLPHYLTNSHHFSGWSRAFQRFSSNGWEELNQRLLSKNWKIFVNIPSKSFHRYFPEQYFYLQDTELSSSSSQVLPISSDFLGSYHFAFSEAFFLLMLSSLISAVALTKDEVLRISPAAAGSIVVSSRYSKFYYFLQQQYTLTTSTAASVSSNATGTSSLLLLLQTGNDVSNTITIQQIHEIYADCLLLLFSRMRYLFILSHFSILYYYRYVTTLTVIGSTSSVLINNYPRQSTVLSLLSSTECLLQGIEMMENLFLQQLMLVVENEVKRYHDYQRFMQVNNNAAVLNALNNNSSTNNSFQPKTPQELIQQSLEFISENKMIHSLLYSLYYSKLSSSSILASGFGGSKDYHFIKMVLQSFFSPLSLNYQYRYLLLNQVKIPSTFQLFEIEEFLRKMVLLFDDNAEDPENQLDADEDSEDEGELADEEEGDEDNEEKDAQEKEYDNNSYQETKQKEQSVMNSRRSTALKSSPKHVIKNHQNENLICDLLFINPNFLFIKYFYLVQQISQESIYQSAIQQFIENNHYDEATTPHYNVPSNNSATAGVASSGNVAQKSSDNTAPNSGHNSRRPSAATASAHSTNPAAHHRGTSSGTTLKTNYYYQILQMKSFCSNHFFLLIQQSLHQFYRKLSSIQKISWKNNKEAMKQMKEHSLTDMKIGSNNKGGGGGGSVSGGSSVVGGSNYRRRFGQRIILRFQSREYDSLWAFLLLEIYQFNKYYSIMMKYFFSFLHNYSSYETWIEYFQQFYLQHPFLYQHHLHFQSRPNATSSPVSSPLPSMTTEMLMHQQADIIHSLYLNCMIQLSQQCIPSIWLHYHDSIFTSVVNCSMDQWHQTILEQRQMLWQWLIDGKPSNISLYLLYNPSGLFYALRETFALKTDTIVDKVFLHYEVIPLILHQQEQFYYYYQHQQELLQTAHPVPPPSSLSPNASSSPRRSRKQLQQQQQTVRSPVAVNTSNTDPASGNTLAEAMSIASVFVANYDQAYITGSMGCYVHLTNITFMNALFSARSNMMEFMPFHAVSPHGSDVVIRVYTSLEEQSLLQEDTFNCPVFIPANHSHPMYLLSNALQFPQNRNQPVHGNTPTFSQGTSPTAANKNTNTESNSLYQQDNAATSAFERMGLSEEERNEKQPIIILPVNTLEDREDCALNRICLVSSPSWFIAHS